MLIYVFREEPCTIIQVIVEGTFHILIGHNRRIVYCCKRLLCVRSLLEEVHDFFELVFRTLR